jgi:pantothenate kinase type III
MLLCDAGNTALKIARADAAGALSERRRIPNAELEARSSELAALFTGEEALLASVSPKTTALLRGLAPSLRVIGEELPCPIPHPYPPPAAPGIDRRLNALAALSLAAAPVIVMSFGSAVVIDVATPEAGLLGGCILPGLRWAFAAVNERAGIISGHAFDLAGSRELLGKSTAQSLSIGVRFGVIGAARHYRERVAGELGIRRTIATGGDAALFAKDVDPDCAVDEDLTFRGILSCLRAGNGQ